MRVVAFPCAKDATTDGTVMGTGVSRRMLRMAPEWSLAWAEQVRQASVQIARRKPVARRSKMLGRAKEPERHAHHAQVRSLAVLHH